MRDGRSARRRQLIAVAAAAATLVAIACSSSYSTTTPDDGGAAESSIDAATTDAGAADGGDDAAPRYAAAVLADGPIAYYRLGDSVAPNAKDEGPSHLTGTYRGGVTLGVPGAIAGDPDTAAQFDGVDDLVTVDLPSTFDFAGKATFSVEAWIKGAVGDGDAIVGKSVYDGGAYAGWFLAYNHGPIEFDRLPQEVSAPAPPSDAFVHVVATFDGVTLLFYLNGAQVASDTTDPNLAATGAPMMIGGVANWGRHTGVIDEVAIYDKPLPPARIVAHYEIGIGAP